MKTQGQINYEIDVKRKQTYHDGTPRKQWSELSDIAQWSWNSSNIFLVETPY
jgi:hypothetical protein